MLKQENCLQLTRHLRQALEFSKDAQPSNLGQHVGLDTTTGELLSVAMVTLYLVMSISPESKSVHTQNFPITSTHVDQVEWTITLIKANIGKICRFMWN